MKRKEKVALNLLKGFFSTSVKKCDSLCQKNGITINNVQLLSEEFRNITTFELSNGWQLDYRIELYETEYCAHFDVDPKKSLFLPDIGFTRVLTIYPDNSRCKDPKFTPTAILQIFSNTFGEGCCNSEEYDLDELETFINPRLYLVSKMNHNDLKIFNPDYLYSSWLNDTYTFKDTRLYNHRVIQCGKLETELLQEIIQSLDDMKIIKSCIYKREESEFGRRFCLDGEELELPVKVPKFASLKRKFKKDYQKKEVV